MAEEAVGEGRQLVSVEQGRYGGSLNREAYVKSPVASLCLACSSVRKRVSVTILVLIFSWDTGGRSPFSVDIVVEEVQIEQAGKSQVKLYPVSERLNRISRSKEDRGRCSCLGNDLRVMEVESVRDFSDKKMDLKLLR